MKILARGRKSIYDGSEWLVSIWRKKENAPKDGEPCGVGFHSLRVKNPLQSPVFKWPCEVWRDECRELLGKDNIKARYRKQRIIEDITHRFPTIVSVNEFLDDIPKTKWFQAQPPEDWMIVENYPTVETARTIVEEEGLQTAHNRYRAFNLSTASLGENHFCCRTDAVNAVTDTLTKIPWIEYNDMLHMNWCAGGYAIALLVADLKIDTTWLCRWWKAWELGYYPLFEKGDKLVVGKIATR